MLNVVMDIHEKENTWLYMFDDGSEVRVEENFQTIPVSLRRLGLITAEQKAAIESYSALKFR